MRLLFAILLLLCGAAPATAQDEAGVRRAFLFAYPVYKLAQTRAAALAHARTDPNGGYNTFVHRQTLSDATSRAVTTPNNDTLYSSAWLDLSGGPVVLEMPSLPSRYHSVALMSAFTDNVAVLGSRAQHGRGGRFLLTGPFWRGSVPKGMTRIALPTDDCWALLRVLVDGSADLPAAAAAQARFRLTPLAPRQPVRFWDAATPAQPSPAELLAVVNAALGRGPMPHERVGVAAGLARFGIVPGKIDAWSGLAPEVRRAWQEQLPSLLAGLRNGFAAVGTEHNGWSYPRRGMGEFGADDYYRSAVALGGLAALPAKEAMYISGTRDREGALLKGSRRYQLHLPRDIPVDAFWSLSMYEIAEDGRLFFTPNAMGRYAVGNRTSGLRRNADGSLDLLIQHDQPGLEARANWLPAPPGPFRLTFRAYLPRPAFSSGAFRIDPLIPLTGSVSLQTPYGGRRNR